jgi:hypothetical protein
MEFQEFESGGRFGLTIMPSGAYDSDSGDLGRGDGYTTAYFLTAEGRTYYKQAEREREQTRKLARELQWVDRAIARAFTAKGRIRRKVVMELVASAEARRKGKEL